MKTNENQLQRKKDIEEQIEACREEIREYTHGLWYFIVVIYIFFGGLVGGVIVLYTPVADLALFRLIAWAGIVIAVIVGGVTFFFYVDIVDRERPKRVYPFVNNLIIDRFDELREAKRTLAALQRQLTQYNEYMSNQLPSPEQHAEHLPRFIASYRKQADRYQWWFKLGQIIIIVLSVTVTNLSGGWLDRYISLPWTIPVGSGLVSILSTLLLFFKPREKGANLRETADAMDLEFKACGLGITPYNNKAKDEALQLLAERTEVLRRDQLQKQQQLEQTSNKEQKDK